MSKIIRVEKKCARCNHIQESGIILSESSFGYMDLDSRPASPKRDNLWLDMEICENCYYVNKSIDMSISIVEEEIISSEKYEEIASDKSIYIQAKKFILAGYIYKMKNKFLQAGIAYLKAAWVFDDLMELNNAKKARIESIENLIKGSAIEYEEDNMVVLVDIKRRAGLFNEAIVTAKMLMNSDIDDFKYKILKYQIELCKKNDDKCHNVEEIIEN